VLTPWARRYGPLLAGPIGVMSFWDLITLKWTWMPLPYFPGPGDGNRTIRLSQYRGLKPVVRTGRATSQPIRRRSRPRSAAGDIVTGSATVILAMAAGRKAARSIHAYLCDGGTALAWQSRCRTASCCREGLLLTLHYLNVCLDLLL
jgi:hypothetical protein